MSLRASLRTIMNMAFLIAYASVYNGARGLAGRVPMIWPVIVGAIIWPIIITLFEPNFETRATIFSWLVVIYMAATTFEFAYGASRQERSRHMASILCALHGLFYVARAFLGASWQVTPAASHTTAAIWGSVISLEAVPFAALIAILVISISMEQVARREKLLANTDFLTGIGNRRAFESTMASILDHTDESTQDTLMLLDLDNFKSVNDQLGHETGDRLLEAVVKTLQTHLPQPDLFWRLGGDEFAIVLRQQTASQVEALRTRIYDAMGTSPRIAEIIDDIPVSISIGTARIFPGQSLAKIMRRSDAALYQDKGHSKSRESTFV